MKKKTIALVRVSTEEQDKDSQLQGIKEFCKKENLIIDEIIETKVSGYRTKIEDREDLKQIKMLAFNKEIEKLIVYDLDRLGRNAELTEFTNLLNYLDVKLYSAREGIEVKSDTAIDRMINNIKYSMAELESQKISHRVKGGHLAKQENKQFAGGRIAVGYYHNKTTSKLEVVETEAQLVKRIYQMAQSDGIQKIATTLNNEGLKTKRGKRWTGATVYGILTNEMYIGRKKYSAYYKESKDKYTKGTIWTEETTRYYEDENLRIISDELFNKVQDIMKSRTICKGVVKTNKSEDILEGLMFHKCSDGEIRKMTIDYNYSRSIKNKGDKTLTYKCLKCKITGAKAIKKSIVGYRILPIVESIVCNKMMNIDNELLQEKLIADKEASYNILNDSIKKKYIELEQNKKIKANAEAELKKYFLGESNFGGDIINDMIVNAKNSITKLESEISKLEVEFNSNNSIENDVEFLVEKYKNFEIIYNNSSSKNKKILMNEIVEKIVFDGVSISVIFKQQLGYTFTTVYYYI